MTKAITPMSRLKGRFEKLLTIFNAVGLFHSEHTFQEQKKARSEYENDRKGIDSDFIRIFNIDDDCSFAFRYMFFEPDKKTISTTQSFEVLFKENGAYSNSRSYTIDEAKELLKRMYVILSEEQSLDKKTIYNCFKQACELSVFEIKDMENELHSHLNELHGSDIETLKHELSERKRLTDKLESSELELLVYRSNLPEKKQIQEHYKQIRELEAIVAKKVSDKENELEIRSTKTMLTSIKTTITDLKSTLICNATSIGLKLGMPTSKAKELLDTRLSNR